MNVPEVKLADESFASIPASMFCELVEPSLVMLFFTVLSTTTCHSDPVHCTSKLCSPERYSGWIASS